MHRKDWYSQCTSPALPPCLLCCLLARRRCLDCTDATGADGDYQLAVCPKCRGSPGRIVSLDILNTVMSKFAHKKEAIADLGATVKAARPTSRTKSAGARQAGDSRTIAIG